MSVTILVVTCDAYSDLWDPFFTLFRKFWADCPYSIYLQTNHKEYLHEDVNTIKIGDDIDWSSNLIKALDQIPSSRVLILLEDFFLCQLVQTNKIEKLVALMLERNASYLRLVPKPPPDCLFDEALKIGVLKKRATYRVSFQAGIWEKEVLRKLLKPGENAWVAEMEGSRRSDAMSQEFLSVGRNSYTEWPIHYLNAVIKKKWTPEAVLFCKENAIPLDLNKRLICNRYDQLRRKRFFRKTVSLGIVLVRFILGKRIYARFKSNPFLRRLIY